MIAGMLVTAGAVGASAQERGVLVAEVDGPITPVIANHLAGAVEVPAAKRGAPWDEVRRATRRRRAESRR